MSSDPLSSMLGSIRLTGGAFLRAELRAPFSLETMTGADTCAVFGRTYAQVIPYHVVVSGSCWVGLPGEARIEVGEGTALLFPRGDAHVLAHARDRPAQPIAPLLPAPPVRGPFRLSAGGSGRPTQLVCGYLACERLHWNPMLECLPRLLAVNLGDGPLLTWMNSSLEYALLHSSTADAVSDSRLARLSELLFGECLRRYADSLPPTARGWLAAIADRHLAAALARMHGDAARAWTLRELASEAGMSRSAFSEHFRTALGLPPLAYLTRWRMQIAAELLRTTDRTMLSIAMDTGYRSDAALIRAFRREFGVSPARWRRDHGTVAADRRPSVAAAPDV